MAGRQHRLTTDPEGRVEHDIPATATEATLAIKDPSSPLNGVIIPLKLGHLDSVKTRSGQRARLANLGYAAGPAENEDDGAFVSAVEEFHSDHGLDVDGKCGPRTQAKLLAVHGC